MALSLPDVLLAQLHQCPASTLPVMFTITGKADTAERQFNPEKVQIGQQLS